MICSSVNRFGFITVPFLLTKGTLFFLAQFIGAMSAAASPCGGTEPGRRGKF
jgi:hypothetical protein